MVNKQNREKQVEVKVMGISLSPLRAIFQWLEYLPLEFTFRISTTSQ
jgi:hypothetical protein